LNKISSRKNLSKVFHLSFGGEENVEYLKKRFEALQKKPTFKDMVFSTDLAQLKEWMPLVMEGRDESEKVNFYGGWY
jgi:malate dehydrogenase (quinone)